MPNTLIKIIKYDEHDMGDDDPDIWNDGGWHISVSGAGDAMILCSGMYYEAGCSNMLYEEKVVARGGITCKECLDRVRYFKGIKL